MIRLGSIYEPTDYWTVVEVASDDMPKLRRLLAFSVKGYATPMGDHGMSREQMEGYNRAIAEMRGEDGINPEVSTERQP